MRRNYALAVGINQYPGTGADLAGCVNDAKDWELALLRLDYECTLLLDAYATKAAMVDALRELIGKARYGDRVVFQYSGHGTWLPDLDGDEADSRDEALVCHDYARGREFLLLDDELQAIFGEAKFGVRRLILSDSCHSGSVSRFAPTPGGVATKRFLPPAAFLGGQDLRLAKVAQYAPVRGGPRPGTVLISGCADPEYSYDASFDGRPNGAFSRVAIDEIAVGVTRGVAAWHSVIRNRLPSDSYPQSPQLVAKMHQRRWRL